MARLVAAVFTLFLIIGGTVIWYRVIVAGEMPWGRRRNATKMPERFWNETPPSSPPPVSHSLHPLVRGAARESLATQAAVGLVAEWWNRRRLPGGEADL